MENLKGKFKREILSDENIVLRKNDNFLGGKEMKARIMAVMVCVMAVVNFTSAVSASTSTQLFFDDFTGTALDTSLWSVFVDIHGQYHKPYVADGFLHSQGYHTRIDSIPTFAPMGQGVIARARIRLAGEVHKFGFAPNPNERTGPINGYYFDTNHLNTSPFGREHYVQAVAWSQPAYGPFDILLYVEIPVTWYEFHEFAIERTPSEVIYSIDGQEVARIADAFEGALPVGVWNDRWSLMQTDWVEVSRSEPPCPPMPSHEPWSFVQISDTHMGYDNSRAKLVAVLNKLKNENIDFVVVTGDISDTGCPGNCYLDDPSSPEWCGTKCPGSYADFKVIMSRLYFDKGIITYTIPGNHDRRYSAPTYANVSPNDLLCYSWHLGSSQVVTAWTHRDEFDHKGIKFVTLDTGDDNCFGSLIDDDIDFLKDLNPCIPKVILTHHPAVADPFEGSWKSDISCGLGGVGIGILGGREDFIKYCENSANNVYMVLSGHTHNNHVYDKNRETPTDYPWYIQTGSTLDGFARIISFASATSPPTVRLVQLTEEDYNYEAAKLHSPGNLHAYDSNGRHAGYEPGRGSEHGIPQSVYFSHYVYETEEDPMVSPEEVMILDPTDDYLWEVVGTEEGTYGLDITSVTGGVETAFKAVDIPTLPGARHAYAVNWAALSDGEDEAVVLGIDADGDSIFERTVIADENLTSEEFALQTETVIDFEPDVLNFGSRAKVATVYIELSEGFEVSEIDISSLKLNDSAPALLKPVKVGDHDEDGIADLMVKFDRQQVIEILGSGTQMVTLTGQLSDGRPLAGIDFIRVIDSTKAETVEPEYESIMPEEFIADLEANLQTTEDDTADKSDDETFDVEEAAAFMLFEAGDIISELGPESFNSQESAIELSCAINDVFTMLDEGIYFEVIVILEGNILERMDGCANIGEPDKDDWITSIEAQALVYPLVVETIELLQILVE